MGFRTLVNRSSLVAFKSELDTSEELTVSVWISLNISIGIFASSAARGVFPEKFAN